MQSFSNVLFVPDVSDRSSEYYDLAISLAAANQAELTILGIVPPAPSLQSFVRLGTPPRPVSELLEAEIAATLASYAHTRTGIGAVDLQVVHGQPASEIVRRVVDFNHDLVLLTSSGSEQADTLLKRVLRLSPCAVQALRPRVETRNVLAALDPNGRRDLNISILRHARSLATRHGGDLHIMHSWELHGEVTLAKSKHLDFAMAELASYADAVQETHRRQLDKLLTEAGEDQCANTHLVNGSPAKAIETLVRQYRIDLLVMGSVGRSDYDGVVVGNTAESVSQSVGCSVLVIKPGDFVCAVTPTADQNGSHD